MSYGHEPLARATEDGYQRANSAPRAPTRPIVGIQFIDTAMKNEDCMLVMKTVLNCMSHVWM